MLDEPDAISAGNCIYFPFGLSLTSPYPENCSDDISILAPTGICCIWCCFPLAQEPKSRFPTYDEPDHRIGTPNDPLFDCAEPDDEDGVLTWRATGDDWRIGRPAYYDIRGFSAIPEHWEAWNKGKQLGKIETLMGGRESYVLPILESLPILGLIAVDTAGNRSIPVYISQQPERGNH